MLRLKTSISLLAVQLVITSCTGYGIIYDDKRSESTENEQYCLKQPTTQCLIDSAFTIADTMSDDFAHAEAYAILAKTQFKLGNDESALMAISKIRIIPMQFNALLELSRLAQKHSQSTIAILALADSLTGDTQTPQDKIAALLLSAILYLENQNHRIGNIRLKQAVELAKESTLADTTIINLQFFKNLLPKLLHFNATHTIEELISIHAIPSQKIAAQTEYLIQRRKSGLFEFNSTVEQLMVEWRGLSKQQQKLAQPTIIKLLVRFDRLKKAREIREQQIDLITRVTLSSIIINQLSTQTNIDEAKQELVGLLQVIRTKSITNNSIDKQKTAQDNFILDHLRAQAIADVALALGEKQNMTEAVHLAEQIQTRMAHIQGYTLTKLAMKYVVAGDVNAGLLTMESIYRPVNRAACLAQISAEVAKYGNHEDLSRAIVIASRINRQSWLDIANSEISIAQAQLNDVQTAMKTLDTIQRSFSAVYAMSEIARTLHLRQNKR